MATVLNLYADPHLARSLPDVAHVVQFYTDDSFLLDGLGASLSSSLKAGEAVVVVMTKAHQKGLTKRFLAQGIPVPDLLRSGQLTVLDASEMLKKFMDPSGPNRQRFFREIGAVIRRAEAAAQVKGKRVMVFGEMVAVLWSRNKRDAAVRLEQLWNDLARIQFFYLHCAYPAKWFRGEDNRYSLVCAEHSVVIPA